MRITKAVLRRVGGAALSGLTDVEITRNPAAAMRLAQSAMRGALAAAKQNGDKA